MENFGGAFKRMWDYFILSPDLECVWNHAFLKHVCLFCLVAEVGFTFDLPFYQEIRVPVPLS